MSKESRGKPKRVSALNDNFAKRPRHIEIFVQFTMVAAIIGVLLVSLSQHIYFRPPILPNSPDSKVQHEEFSWDTVAAHPDLVFSKCYECYHCARLLLPMDYWNGTTNATIDLAIIRKPAKVPVTDPRYGGAILLNPGGPGGLGTEFVLTAGEEISGRVDDEGEGGKLFDLVSFDPRGIGHSRPSINCFEDPVLGQTWDIRMLEGGLPDVNDVAFGRIWAIARARAKSCSIPLPDGEADIRKYVTTASVARDMLEITERLGKWREEEAERLLEEGRRTHHASPASSGINIVGEVRYKPGKEKLQYWGFSYGTFLGLTFAAMFPERVQRLAIDGVMDPYDYTQTQWFTSLDDAEKAMDAFYLSCATAGYPLCALANDTGETTVEEVKRRVLKIFHELTHEPLAVAGSNPEIITAADITNMIFLGIYRPVGSFPVMAKILSDIESGDGTTLATTLLANHAVDCKADQSGISAMKGYSSESLMAVACTDGNDQTSVDRAEFERYLTRLTTVSPTLAPLWSLIRLHCVHYTIRPFHRFTGPWEGETHHPLLLIGNTADPYTPFANAQAMARNFKDAVALAQESPGHCTLGAFSDCTVGHIRQYFQTGRLPPPDTVCAADEQPFGVDQDAIASALTVESKGRRSRAAHFASAALTHGGFFGKLFGARRVEWLH
ncbi:alpha/beta-hydrolase [Myriangium duriaei CBS 260.36]|uniref:Alpha/beta-hydrolase n=1 Tax=Myriangium duriaei CBS 260.36 TaxID=1168546 RepID=A0A9P4J9I8_9PEZI|nr:alpha/beta-hydrolase [Myriangium duriaei CBS 260.36]